MTNLYQHVACPSFSGARSVLALLLKTQSSPVQAETWQGKDVRGRPDMRSHELLNVTLHVPLRRGESFDPLSIDHWRQDCSPNLPWADVHFDERVGGKPVNPPPSWRIWPWADSAARFKQGDAAVECRHGRDHCPECDVQPFDHSYPERFWPKYAGIPASPPRKISPNEGIRFEYGDLLDVVEILVRDPHTRQAYLPIYYPEDNAPEARRKPCTLGYQFIMRDDHLHLFYPMRSCDFVRHWADDCYLAVRLLLWVIDSCRNLERNFGKPYKAWQSVGPGSFTMHMTSLHVFENDRRSL